MLTLRRAYTSAYCVCFYVSGQMEFWTEMQKPSPSVARLIELGMQLDHDATQREELISQQLAISPNSIQTIRRYAQFLLEVREGSDFKAAWAVLSLSCCIRSMSTSHFHCMLL